MFSAVSDSLMSTKSASSNTSLKRTSPLQPASRSPRPALLAQKGCKLLLY